MSQVLSQEETKIANAMFFEKISSRDPMLVKEAEDAINDFTRTTMREEGIMRRIMPPVTITDDELDRVTWTDKPMKVVDKEPNSPAAISVPFATLPETYWIRGPRYAVMFSRIMTPRFTKDVDELRTWIMDIRQVLSDNAIKDLLVEEDTKFLRCTDTAVGALDSTSVTSGVIQNKTINGGITRESLKDALKVMPSTPSKLEVHTLLINHITVKDLIGFGRTEIGGDMAQDIFKNGWTETELMGRRLVVTIKSELVGNNVMYGYASPKFIGKHYQLGDQTVMYVRREAFLLEFFAYQTSGATFGHTDGLQRTYHR